MCSNSQLHYAVSYFLQLPAISTSNWLLKVVAFQVPDFCWSLSLASSLFLFQGKTEWGSYFFSFVVLLLLVGAEFIQSLFPQHFTFDWGDVVAAVLAFLLSYNYKPKT